MIPETATETLWLTFCRLRLQSCAYRAVDDPIVARAYADWLASYLADDRPKLDRPQSNVIPFRKSGLRRERSRKHRSTPRLCSIELEQEILGAVLVNNSALDDNRARGFGQTTFPNRCTRNFLKRFASVHDAHGIITPALVIASMGGDASAIVAEGMTLGQYVARHCGGSFNSRAMLRPTQSKSASLPTVARFWRWRKQCRRAFKPTNRRRISRAAGIELLDEIAMQASAGSTPQVSLCEAADKSLERMQYGMQNPGKLAGISWGLEKPR